MPFNNRSKQSKQSKQSVKSRKKSGVASTSFDKATTNGHHQRHFNNASAYDTASERMFSLCSESILLPTTLCEKGLQCVETQHLRQLGHTISGTTILRFGTNEGMAFIVQKQALFRALSSSSASTEPDSSIEGFEALPDQCASLVQQDPATASLFVEWIHDPRIPVALGDPHTDLVQLVTIAYELGTTAGASAFSNIILDAFYVFLCEVGTEMSPTRINFVYQHTGSASPLRAVVAEHLNAVGTFNESPRTLLEACDKDFIIDLYDSQNRQQDEFHSLGVEAFCQRYHVHDADEAPKEERPGQLKTRNDFDAELIVLGADSDQYQPFQGTRGSKRRRISQSPEWSPTSSLSSLESSVCGTPRRSSMVIRGLATPLAP